MAGIGGTIAVAGTGTVIGTQVVKKCLNTTLLERAQAEIDQHYEYKDQLVKTIKKIETMCYKISIKCKVFGAEAVYTVAWRFFGKAKAKDSIDMKAVKTALGFAQVAFQSVYGVIVAVGVVGTGAIALNLFELVNSAIVIHKKEPHPAAVEIRKVTIVQMEVNLTKLRKVYDLLTAKCEAD